MPAITIAVALIDVVLERLHLLDWYGLTVDDYMPVEFQEYPDCAADPILVY